ncbi:MAG: eukaryotic-like serine/threonine-protein kinase [Solirubrobacteraceae bacterium]|nr:eukaryotic-like serine/threonine-protein kinase [Solirubrobacteraceae bacterium]
MSSQTRLVAGRFRTIRRLGAGAMASVFLAEDCELGRMVAIKRLHPESSAEVAPRFRREMRVAASLSHPHIVTLYDAILDEEAVLLVMEYVEGPTLAERLRDAPLPPQDALELLRDLADAVDYLHGQGVIHRDIKPANVLLDSGGRVKLTDLGIASAAHATGITTEGTILGTPAYMAPELFEGERATRAADVYSLGAIAYELLTGRRAREGGTPAVIALRATSEEPPDLRELRPDAPALAGALQRGMARSPDDRPPTATALVDEIAAALERDGAPHAAPAPTDAPTAPAPQRTREVSVPAPATDGPAADRPAPERRDRAVATGAPRPPSERRVQRAAPAVAERPRPTGGRRARGLLVAALALVAAAVAAIVVAGTGSGDRTPSAQRTTASSGGDRTATTSERRTTTTGQGSAAPATTSTSTRTSPAPAAGATAETPEGAVQSFYGLAAAHRYEDAWALAAPSLRSQLGGFGAFRSQFATVRSIRFQRAETVQRGGNAAMVAITTTATHTDRVDHCAGTAQTVPGPDGGWLVGRLAVNC